MKRFILLILFPTICHSVDLPTAWQEMQSIYKKLTDIPLDSRYILPIWQQFSRDLATLINGPINNQFLMHPSICPPMLRMGFGNTTQFELNYLNNCLTTKNSALIANYYDVEVGGLRLDCPGKKWSSNSVGQLFYLGKIIEQIDYEKIETFVEFGGGYGCLARITKSLLPKTTYVIIDLPELLAIQYLYLRATLDGVAIVVQTDPKGHIQKAAINLIPVSILEGIDLKATVFTSNFALSESPEITQKLVIHKQFFSATVCYVNGQIESWGSNNSWRMPSHLEVINSLKNLYPHTYLQPHHIFDGPVCSYEIIGVR